MKAQTLFYVFLCVVLSAAALPAHAQEPCPYATLRIDTAQPVDTDAICTAAEPWADDGFRVLVVITDIRAGSESDWFNYLDTVEADAGFRDPNTDDAFLRNGIAFEASTAIDVPWGTSLTFGERLFGSSLDTDAASDRVKERMHAGTPGAGMASAIETAYSIYQPAPIPAPTAVQPQPADVGEQAESPSVVRRLFAPLLGLLVLIGATFVAIPLLVLPALARRRRRRELARHLETLQARTATVMTAADQLLSGESPEATILYQLFRTYGGEQYENLQTEVREWIRRSQAALNDAFELRQQLGDATVRDQRPLEQQVRDWEMLYLTVVGSSERIRDLTDDELRTLLDPLLVLEHQADDVQLAEQLDAIRREIAGQPLSVDLMLVDAAETDAEGILGYLDRVQAQIAMLQAAKHDAPVRLDEAGSRRQTVEQDIPDPFVMTPARLFAPIDAQLDTAKNLLVEERYLDVLDAVDTIEANLDVVTHLRATVDAHTERIVQIAAITEQGYRPTQLPTDETEIATDRAAIVESIDAGDYAGAENWIQELALDSTRALKGTLAWRDLHRRNRDALIQLSSDVERVRTYLTETTQPAWNALQTYPDSNWADLAEDMAAATTTLRRLHAETVPYIARVNSIAEQQLPQAEHLLDESAGRLRSAETTLTAVAGRLSAVRTAESNIGAALNATSTDIARAAALRDREDSKVGPDIDQKIAEAGDHLAAAQRLVAERAYYPATRAQTEAHRLANEAFTQASEQIRHVDELLSQLDTIRLQADEQVGRLRMTMQAVPAVALTAATHSLVNRTIQTESDATHSRVEVAGLEDTALGTGLETAIAAYNQTIHFAQQAQERIEADRAAYMYQLEQTQQAIQRAHSAIRSADETVHRANAHGAGRHPLERARAIVPEMPTGSESAAALERSRSQAEDARTFANEAERQARSRIDATERERRRQQRAAASAIGLIAMSRRQSHSSAAGVSSRSGSRVSSSHRSSSTGSSSRRSSMGSSRRR